MLFCERIEDIKLLILAVISYFRILTFLITNTNTNTSLWLGIIIISNSIISMHHNNGDRWIGVNLQRLTLLSCQRTFMVLAYILQ